MVQTSQPPPQASIPNYHFVQNYVRDNPGMALDYLSALLRHNAQHYNPPGPMARAKIFLPDAAELLSGRRLARQRAMFLAHLDERTPSLPTSFPVSISCFLFNHSAGYLFAGPRAGAALLGSSPVLSSPAAEEDLSKHMQAPVIIAAGHLDGHLLKSGTAPPP